MGKMSLTSCRALSTPGKFSNVDRYVLCPCCFGMDADILRVACWELPALKNAGAIYNRPMLGPLAETPKVVGKRSSPVV